MMFYFLFFSPLHMDFKATSLILSFIFTNYLIQTILIHLQI